MQNYKNITIARHLSSITFNDISGEIVETDQNSTDSSSKDAIREIERYGLIVNDLKMHLLETLVVKWLCNGCTCFLLQSQCFLRNW